MEIQSSESGLAELDSQDSFYHKSAGPGLYGNRSLDQRKDPMDLSYPGAGIPGAFPGLYLEKSKGVSFNSVSETEEESLLQYV